MFSFAAVAPLLSSAGTKSEYERSVAALRDRMSQWGMCREGKHVLHRFSYATKDSSAFHHFHSGVAAQFLRDFFHSEEVQAVCRGVVPATSSSTVLSEAPVYRELLTTWLTLAPFDRLEKHRVIRRVPGRDSLDEEGEDAEERLPSVKRPEKCIHGDIVITDEVRSLFLDTYSRPVGMTEDDGDEDDGMMFYMSDHSLSREVRLDVFAPGERNEILYHIMWRLVAGGGSMNQFDDDFNIYRYAARTLLRLLITSLRVTHDEPSGQYVPQAQSLAFQVMSLSQRESDHSLWSAEDGYTPSNLNYCYVIVNPEQHEVILWYNAV